MLEENTSLAEAVPKDTVTRDQAMYHANGDLVVSARTPVGGLHLFRVHTSILGQFSPVFGDMLKLPSGSHGREMFDGAPLVHFPDPVGDVGELFRSFYNPGYPLFKRSDPSFPLKAYGLMQIATKYQVDSICQAVRHHLESEWPTTLGDLLRLLNDMAAIRHDIPRLPELEKGLSDVFSVFPEPAAAIRLAMDFEITTILPAAFYLLSTVDYDPVELKVKSYSSSTARLTASRFAHLKDSELVRYFQGRTHFTKMIQRTFYMVLWIDDRDGCEFGSTSDSEESGEDEDCEMDRKPTECENTLDELEKQIKEKSNTILWPCADPLRELMDMRKKMREKASSTKLCFFCFQAVDRQISARMQDIWDKLPRVFDVPSGAKNQIVP